jgi:anti-sigma factor RsiW
MSGQILPFDDSEHRIADALLPWFVNGTLSDDERASVDRHLRECARCRREVEVLRQLQAFCRSVPASIDATPGPRNVKDGASAASRRGSIAPRLQRFLEHWRRAPQWTRWVIAGEFAVAVALTAFVGAHDPESSAPYRTLGTASPASPFGTIAVVFMPDIAEAEMRRILQAAGARIVDGPTATDAYVLQVPTGHRTDALTTLRSEPAVVFAEPLFARADR